jgi:hypothetical protein
VLDLAIEAADQSGHRQAVHGTGGLRQDEAGYLGYEARSQRNTDAEQVGFPGGS